ncbi:MAG: hypothetical protein U1C48_04000 [Methylotenera sp.]|nr:hypothetical protein [Methylotenera sp.]
MKLKIMLVLLVMLCSAQQVYADCFGALAYDPDLYKIADKVALGGVRAQTFSMLANENRPTSDEIQAVFKWGEKREQCLKSFPTSSNPVDQIQNEAFNVTQSLILDLYKGSITYSQFARLRQDNSNAADARIQQINGQLQMQMQQYQQQQMQQQQFQQQQKQQQRQACLNRARNQFDVANCNLYAAGEGIGEAIINMSR